MKDLATLERRQMAAEVAIENRKKQIEQIGKELEAEGIKPDTDVEAVLAERRKEVDEAKEAYEKKYDEVDRQLSAAEELLR